MWLGSSEPTFGGTPLKRQSQVMVGKRESLVQRGYLTVWSQTGLNEEEESALFKAGKNLASTVSKNNLCSPY